MGRPENLSIARIQIISDILPRAVHIYVTNKKKICNTRFLYKFFILLIYVHTDQRNMC